jgi:hypothetical protein
MFSIHVGFGNWAIVWVGSGGSRVRLFGMDIVSQLFDMYEVKGICNERTRFKQKGELGEDMRKARK